ncbi:MAG TPA: hypothetical protein VM032_15910 [Vicinamibacterales bacterium]|nr:hypothetical protein [Vicinamibacterales bacterium]
MTDANAADANIGATNIGATNTSGANIGAANAGGANTPGPMTACAMGPAVPRQSGGILHFRRGRIDTGRRRGGVQS